MTLSPHDSPRPYYACDDEIITPFPPFKSPPVPRPRILFLSLLKKAPTHFLCVSEHAASSPSFTRSHPGSALVLSPPPHPRSEPTPLAQCEATFGWGRANGIALREQTMVSLYCLRCVWIVSLATGPVNAMLSNAHLPVHFAVVDVVVVCRVCISGHR